MEDAPQITENSQIGMSRHLDFVHHDTNGLNHWPVSKTQLFLLNGICTVILWQDYYGKGNLRKIQLQPGWEKVSNWECLFVHREKRVILICVCRTTSNWLETNENIDPMWKVLNKEVDLGEPTSFLDHVSPEFPQEQLKNYHARRIEVSVGFFLIGFTVCLCNSFLLSGFSLWVLVSPNV